MRRGFLINRFANQCVGALVYRLLVVGECGCGVVGVVVVVTLVVALVAAERFLTRVRVVNDIGMLVTLSNSVVLEVAVVVVTDHVLTTAGKLIFHQLFKHFRRGLINQVVQGLALSCFHGDVFVV